MSAFDGKVIGGFRIAGELKSGSQGTVYKAVCEEARFAGCPPGTVVALKTMPVQDEGEEQFARLKRRTDELTALKHRNIVRYFGCFHLQETFAELHVVVMEFLEGETLKERLLRYPAGLDADEAMKVAAAMVSGLTAASARGICHRDVKPANVFMCSDGGIKLIDFEVARMGDVTASSGSGRMIGTFDYMAPDFTDPSFRGDVRSDIFSVGVVMHEVITGRTPYAATRDGGQADFVFMSRWARGPNGSFSGRAVDISNKIRRLLAHTEGALAGALAPERAARFADFPAFAEALRQVRFRDLRNGERAYRILQLIGKGGFGEVFKARLKGTSQEVAVKHLLKSDYAERFIREAKIMAQLRDPCFVRFVDFFVIESSGNREAFLVMDYLKGMPGSSLKDAIVGAGGRGLPHKEVLSAFARYAHGLRVLHAKGIFHRDIKPANLYYPQGRPELAAIMDFGIARDVNGTATTGGVPGTFDYMPPEVVTQQTRGESGMDIYALGLCLYEALSGRTAYPRLPRGSAAYAQFFQRARSLVKPQIDDSAVASNRKLHDLVREMTEPDVSMRLVDTSEVERRLWSLAGEENPFLMADAADTVDGAADTIDATSTIEPTLGGLAKGRDRPKGSDRPKEGKSGKVRLGRRPASATGAVGRRLRIVGMSALTVSLLALCGYMERDRVARWVRSAKEAAVAVKAKWDNRVKARVEEESRRKVAAAEAIASTVASLYDDDAGMIEVADSERDRWIKTWTGMISTQEIARIGAGLDVRRTARLTRVRLNEERRAREERCKKAADEVVAAYAEGGVEAGDRRREEWVKVWNEEGKDVTGPYLTRFDDAKVERIVRNRELAAFKAASRAAAPIGKSYLDEKPAIAKQRLMEWDAQWRKRISPEHYDEIMGKLNLIRDKCEQRQNAAAKAAQERAILDECRTLCEAMDPVDLWMNRLYDAERKLEEGLADGTVGDEAGNAMRGEIEARRKWVAFCVVNKTGHEMNVGGIAIESGRRHLFVFTNAIPTGFSAVCEGFEPIPFSARVRGRTVRIGIDDLVPLGVPVSVPKLPADVECWIDGERTVAGDMKIRPGSHVCVYRRAGCENQSIPFMVERGRPASLPLPGPWQTEAKALARQRAAEHAAELREFAETCRRLMSVDPLATRRARLRQCDSNLGSWRAAEILGDDLLRELKSDLSRESARVIGIVSNLTARPLAVGGVRRSLTVGPGKGMRVEFPEGLPKNALLHAEGYDPVMILGDFDGSVFAVDETMLVPSPVRVTVPPLPGGVTCLLDGRALVGSADVPPGRHTYVYRKGDCADQRQEIAVEINKPVTLPEPGEWEPSSGFASLKSAISAMNEGAMDKMAQFLEAAEVQSEENVRRKRELQRQMALRRRFVELKDEISVHLKDESWLEAMRVYAELKKAGYAFSAGDLKAVADVYEKGRELCKAKRKKAQDSGTAADVEKADADLRKLHVSYGVITGKIAK